MKEGAAQRGRKADDRKVRAESGEKKGGAWARKARLGGGEDLRLYSPTANLSRGGLWPLKA